jgi:hypothetical protein
MQNVHKYTVKTTKEEILPNGRFLKQDELLQEGDLYLSMQAASESVRKSNIGTRLFSCKTKRWYRPETANTKTYRFLKQGEYLEEGDECNVDLSGSPINVWQPAFVIYGRCHVGPIHARGQNFRRPVENKVKTPNKTKYRMLQPHEVIQQGDQCYRKSTRAWVNVRASIDRTVEDWPNHTSHLQPCLRFRRKTT